MSTTSTPGERPVRVKLTADVSAYAAAVRRADERTREVGGLPPREADDA